MNERISALWKQWLWKVQVGRIPHAILLSGEVEEERTEVAINMARYLLCQRTSSQTDLWGNDACKSCELFSAKTHPDFIVIQSDETKSIKIDEIRHIQHQLSYTANQQGWKVVCIEDASALTLNAANSLLKVLEEPSSHTLFLIGVPSAFTLLPTIRSRCEHWPLGVAQAELYCDTEMLEAFSHFVTKKVTLYQLSQQWGKKNLSEIFAFFFGLIAQMIRYKITGDCYASPDIDKIKRMADSKTPIFLFEFYDVLNRSWQDNLRVSQLNTQLMLESLLLRFVYRLSEK